MSAARNESNDRLYDQVANRVTKMINRGSLKSGERIPSIRQMSKQMSVAISTVLHAYQLLEDRGLIEARPQSGYFVRPKHSRRVVDAYAPLEPEKRTLPLKAGSVRIEDVLAMAKEFAGRRDVVPLGTAIQAPEFLPTAAINMHLSRAVRNDPELASRYEIGPGSRQLRERVTRRTVVNLVVGNGIRYVDRMTNASCFVKYVPSPDSVPALERNVFTDYW